MSVALEFQKYGESYRRFLEAAELDMENCDLLMQEGFFLRFRTLFQATINFMSAYMKEQVYEEGPLPPTDLMDYAYKCGYVKNAQVWVDAFKYRRILSVKKDEDLWQEALSFLKDSFYDEVKYIHSKFQEEDSAVSDEGDEFGFNQREWDEIRSVFSSFKEIESCVLFGSRARGSFYKASDVDLAVVGEKIDFDLVLEISHAFDASTLPLMVNVVNYHKPTNDVLKSCILRDGITIYPEVNPKEATNH